MIFESRVAEKLADEFDRISAKEFDFLKDWIVVPINTASIHLDNLVDPSWASWKGVDLLEEFVRVGEGWIAILDLSSQLERAHTSHINKAKYCIITTLGLSCVPAPP